MEMLYDFGGGFFPDPLAALEEISLPGAVRVRAIHNGVISWEGSLAGCRGLQGDFERWCALEVAELAKLPEAATRWLESGAVEDRLEAEAALWAMRREVATSPARSAAWHAALLALREPGKAPGKARLARGLERFHQGDGQDHAAWEACWGQQRRQLELLLAREMVPEGWRQRVELSRQARYEGWPRPWLEALERAATPT